MFDEYLADLRALAETRPLDAMGAGDAGHWLQCRGSMRLRNSNGSMIYGMRHHHGIIVVVVVEELSMHLICRNVAEYLTQNRRDKNKTGYDRA